MRFNDATEGRILPRKLRGVTSKQVAERAGVSQTTVSFVLNRVDDSNISEATRQRVLQAAEELHYVPDMAARALARGRSNNIALVIGQPHRQVFIDEYIPSILTGLNQVTQEHGFRILVELVEAGKNSDSYVNLIRGKEVAGVIVNFVSPSAEDIHTAERCAADHLPIVSLGDLHPNIPSVTVDKLDGVRKVVGHLLSLGHRRIACISYAPFGQPHAMRRLGVYRETLESAGIQYDEALVRFGAHDPETGYAAMQSILRESAPPTALFAMNDVMAFGAMAAIRDAGLRVPDDIAVAGFDDIRLARFACPPLTTVHEPDIEHGRRAGELLISLINGQPPPEVHVRLEAQLIVRQSCGAGARPA
ncbi:MAG: LacI family DNA-binding transcriptional regulator [Chloroflexota bacterium]